MHWDSDGAELDQDQKNSKRTDNNDDYFGTGMSAPYEGWILRKDAASSDFRRVVLEAIVIRMLRA